MKTLTRSSILKTLTRSPVLETLTRSPVLQTLAETGLLNFSSREGGVSETLSIRLRRPLQNKDVDEAARHNSHHNPLLLHVAYKAPCDTHTHTSSAASDAKLDMMFTRLKHIKRVLQLSCSNISFQSFSMSLMLMSCVAGLKHASNL